MSKLNFNVLLSIGIGLLLIGCEGNKYADMESIIRRHIVDYNDFEKAIDKANNGREIAKAINVLALKTERFGEELMKCNNKYIEMGIDINVEQPDEISDIIHELGIVIKKTDESTMKNIYLFREDPEVLAAEINLEKVGSK